MKFSNFPLKNVEISQISFPICCNILAMDSKKLFEKLISAISGNLFGTVRNFFTVFRNINSQNSWKFLIKKIAEPFPHSWGSFLRYSVNWIPEFWKTSICNSKKIQLGILYNAFPEFMEIPCQNYKKFTVGDLEKCIWESFWVYSRYSPCNFTEISLGNPEKCDSKY